ncbi:MAG: SURF1 family protein [Ilumatobacteraceae bacterium]
MYGFLLRPKWLAFHVVVFASIALMVSLSFWQIRRLDERKEFNALVTERIDQPPVPLDDVLADAEVDPEAFEWRQVTVAGTWIPEQVIWFNRTQEGLAGDNILTALDADGGDTTVVVNRGFVGVGNEIPAAPDGDVEVLGRIRLTQARQLGGLTDATDGELAEVRRVDVDAIAPQLPGDVAPFYLDLIGSIPTVTDTDPFPTPAPTLDNGPHVSYAVQWMIFAIAVLVGWVLAIRRSIATRRRDAARDDTGVTDGAADAGPPDLPSSADAASATTPS